MTVYDDFSVLGGADRPSQLPTFVEIAYAVGPGAFCQYIEGQRPSDNNSGTSQVGISMRHTERISLAFGIVSSALFVVDSVILGILLPHYDPVSQTISELGERGSPFQTEFELSTIATAIGVLTFSFGLYRYSARRCLSILPAILLCLYAVTVFGVAVFEAPHPLHNLFGIGGTVGFLAPLALALTWRGEPSPTLVPRVSAILAAIIIAAIALNLSPLFVASTFIEANYGIVQRILFFAFYLWCSYLALSLIVHSRRPEVET